MAAHLDGVKVTDLTFKGGVGRATVQLPAMGIVSADIKSGVGQLNVTIPSSMKARVRVSSGFGVKVVGDFLRGGDISTFIGSGESKNRVGLWIEGSVDAVNIKQLGR